MPLTSTAIGFQAQTLPLTVMVECPSGSSLHGCAELPTSALGWQPRPTRDPVPPVTLPPTVMVAGALSASKLAPAATSRLPRMVIVAPTATSH